MKSLEENYHPNPLLKHLAGNNPVLSIAAETRLLIEIKDIRDE